MKKIIFSVLFCLTATASYGDVGTPRSLEVSNLNGGLWVMTALNGKCSIDQRFSFLHANQPVAYNGNLSSLSDFGITVTQTSNADESDYRVWGKIEEDLVLDIQFSGPSTIEQQFSSAFNDPNADVTYVKLTESLTCGSASVQAIKNLRVTKNIFGH